MPRRSSDAFAWSLNSSDVQHLADARIALALLRCARRLPGTFAAHSSDELGAALAPAIVPHARLAKRLLQTATPGVAPETLAPGFLLERDTHARLGEAIARGTPRFRPLADRVEDTLARHVAAHPFAPDHNLSTLASLLGLDAQELALLRLAAAFCYGAVERALFTFVDSPSRILQVLEPLCGVRGPAGARMLQGDGRLARSGLLEALGGGTNANRLDLDDVLRLSPVGNALLGVPHADEQSMAQVVLSPLAPPRDGRPLEWPHLRLQESLVRAALRSALDGAVAGVNILVHGGPGTGKTEFVRQLVAGLGAPAFSVAEADDEGREATRAERLASLQLSQTFAGHGARSVLVLDEAEDIFQDEHQHPFARLLGARRSESKAWMNALLEKNPHPVVWISNRISHLDPAYLRRFTYCLEFPATPATVRRAVAHDKLSAVGCSETLIDAVAALDAVTPAQLDAAARFAALTQRAEPADVAVASSIRSHLLATGHPEPDLRPARSLRFDLRYLNVAGHATPERVIAALQRGPQAAALLFCGPPGTGKTQLAAEMASRLGRRLVVRTASDIKSKWYGESEGKVAQMFRDCDPHEELLFVDEADVLLGAREASAHDADRAVTSEFLRWLEPFKGVFVCATNHAKAFDAALMRRFTFRMDFRPLDAVQRRELYAELATGWRPDAGGTRPSLDPAEERRLARLDALTPGDFANAARRIRALQMPPDAWLDELEAEHAAKPSARSNPIGFL